MKETEQAEAQAPPVILQYPKMLYKLEVHPPPPPPEPPPPTYELKTLVVDDEEAEKKAVGKGWGKDAPKIPPAATNQNHPAAKPEEKKK